MEIETTTGPQMQRCPGCGELNFPVDVFCKKCGARLQAGSLEQPLMGPPRPSRSTPVEVNVTPQINNNSVPQQYNEQPNFGEDVETEEGSSNVKTILWVILVLAVIGVLAGGGYFWYSKMQKDAAKEYTSISADEFTKSVTAINQLSTDNQIKDKDNNPEIYLKKLEDEKFKAEATLQDIKNAKLALSKRSDNKLVVGISEPLRQYYAEAEDKVTAYDKYYEFSIKQTKEYIRFKNEVEKIQNNFKTITTPQELSNSFKALKTAIDDSVKNLKSINAPEGLTDAQKKSTAHFERFSIILNEIIKAIDENSQDKFKQSSAMLDEYLLDTKTPKEIEDLEAYFFEELHKKFVTLREKADKVKTEMMVLKVSLKAEVKDINIEGW